MHVLVEFFVGMVKLAIYTLMTVVRAVFGD